jgi:hypothetical protein
VSNCCRAGAGAGAGAGGSGAGVGVFTCGVCFDEVPLGEGEGSVALACGHRFCNDCLKSHFTVKIQDYGASKRLPCLQPQCPQSYPEEAVLALVSR